MKEQTITIIGTKGVKQEESDFKIYDRKELLKRIDKLIDDGLGYSIVESKRRHRR